jgi:hypothetical protein
LGIEYNTAKFLLLCREAGVPFGSILTLGRQYNLLSMDEARSLFGEKAAAIMQDSYAEQMFRELGAHTIESLDFSSYEGATVIHDLNEPLPCRYQERFDVVFDGGTLEHIFNFPIALKNAMQAVKISGHLLIHTPANNYCGHGFYQLSPDLYFGALSPANGFVIRSMIAFEAYQGAPWYAVSDPARIGQRVEIARGSQPTLLLVLARRTHVAEIFKIAPQQNYYVAQWKGEKPSPLPLWQRIKQAAKDRRLLYALTQPMLVSAGLQYLARANLGRRISLHAQPMAFRPVDRTRLPILAPPGRTNGGA